MNDTAYETDDRLRRSDPPLPCPACQWEAIYSGATFIRYKKERDCGGHPTR